jgi:hypothetical protein
MTSTTTASLITLVPSLAGGLARCGQLIRALLFGALEEVLCETQQLTGARHHRAGGHVGHRWGTTMGKTGFHCRKVAV